MAERHCAFSRCSGSKEIVLFVHGIQGSPEQFRELTACLPEHIDTMSLLLPGHGGSLRDFRRAGKREWLEYFCGLCGKLSESYEKVFFVGHSLGCLIGIEAAASGAICFDGMLLIACPIRIRPSMRYFAMGWRAIVSNASSDAYVRAAREANSVEVKHPLELLTCVKPYAGLALLIAQSGRKIKRQRARICMIQSDRDEIVSARSMDVVGEMENAKAVVVPGSGHFFYSADAQEIIRRELFALLNGE